MVSVGSIALSVCLIWFKNSFILAQCLQATSLLFLFYFSAIEQRLHLCLYFPFKIQWHRQCSNVHKRTIHIKLLRGCDPKGERRKKRRIQVFIVRRNKRSYFWYEFQSNQLYYHQQRNFHTDNFVWLFISQQIEWTRKTFKPKRHTNESKYKIEIYRTKTRWTR